MFQLSILFSIISYLVNAYFESRRKDLELLRDKIHSKIAFLYGPIAANRMLHTCALKALQDSHGKPIREILEDVCNNKGNVAFNGICLQNSM